MDIRMRSAISANARGAAAVAGNACADDVDTCAEAEVSDVGWRCIAAAIA